MPYAYIYHTIEPILLNKCLIVRFLSEYCHLWVLGCGSRLRGGHPPNNDRLSILRYIRTFKVWYLFASVWSFCRFLNHCQWFFFHCYPRGFNVSSLFLENFSLPVLLSLAMFLGVAGFAFMLSLEKRVTIQRLLSNVQSLFLLFLAVWILSPILKTLTEPLRYDSSLIALTQTLIFS